MTAPSQPAMQGAPSQADVVAPVVPSTREDAPGAPLPRPMPAADRPRPDDRSELLAVLRTASKSEENVNPAQRDGLRLRSSDPDQSAPQRPPRPPSAPSRIAEAIRAPPDTPPESSPAIAAANPAAPISSALPLRSRIEDDGPKAAPTVETPTAEALTPTIATAPAPILQPAASEPIAVNATPSEQPVALAAEELAKLDAASVPPQKAPTPTPTATPATPAPAPLKPATTIAADEAAPETLSVAILSALEKNPEIMIADAQRDEAQYSVAEQRSTLLPSLTLSASHGRERRTLEGPTGSSDAHTRTEISILLRQNLFDFGAADQSVRSSSSYAESVEWAYRAQIDTIALRIASAFHQLGERQAIVDLATQNLAAHEATLRIVQSQREFGMVTGADVSRVETRLNAARSELLDRKSAYDQAREDYRRLLDRAPGPLVMPTGVEDAIPADVDAAIVRLDSSNPTMMQSQKLLQSLQQQRESQKAGGMPRLDLELEGATKENVGGPNGINEEARALVSMRLALFDGGARDAVVNRLGARIRQAEFQVERARRDAVQAIRNDYVALNAAKAKVAAIDDELKSAERLVALYQEQFKSGSRTVFDLLDSQQSLYTAQVRRETNRTEVRSSAYRVLSTLGSLVETVTQADKVSVRLFPKQPDNVRGGRPAGAVSR